MSKRGETPSAASTDRAAGLGGQGELDELEAYHDGELSWWRRRRVEAGLRRSPELRRELDALRQMRTAASAADRPLASPDLWDAIAGQLPAADARRGAPAGVEGTHTPPRSLEGLATWLSGLSGLSGLLGWRPIGWAVAAGAMALAVGVWITPGNLPGDMLTDEPAVGVLRYLDTGGRAVMVLDDEDVTIIWLLEG